MNSLSPVRQDPDIIRLRMLIGQLQNNNTPPRRFSPIKMESNPKEQINQMEVAIGQLRNHSQILGNENRQLVSQLGRQRQENAVLRKMKEESDKQREGLMIKARNSQTPINRIDGPNRDQLFRLSSYMLEHNRNIKILIEKHNYLLKLREAGKVSEEQKMVIESTKALLGGSRRLQEVKRAVGGVDWTLGGSESDNDSSEIEQQKNGMFSSEINK